MLLVSRRFGTIAVAVAVAIPVLYAVTRWTWALGYPLGITETFFRDGQAVGLWWMGAALGTLALVAAVLTLALIRPWGERFPRLLPNLAGRRVPPLLVIVPACIAAVIITSAGLMFVRLSVSGTLVIGSHEITLSDNWGALAPELLWPLWGISLGAATLGYYNRTRAPGRESHDTCQRRRHATRHLQVSEDPGGTFPADWGILTRRATHRPGREQ